MEKYELEKLLKDVKSLVPFRDKNCKVEWGGFHHATAKESWTVVHRWQGGIEKEGHLLLDGYGNLVGEVVHCYSSGVAGVEPHEEVEKYPEVNPHYLLYYWVVNDQMRHEEYAYLYELA